MAGKKLDIYGGFLGAGKTTLIKAMLSHVYRGRKVAIIENEVGRVNLDAGAFPGISVRPLTSGCVCCTLRGDLVSAILQLLARETPDYVIVEASGAADLEVIRQVCLQIDEISLNRCIMVVNAQKCLTLLGVVGDFYRTQLMDASIIYLNFTEGMTRDAIEEVRSSICKINPDALITDTPLADLCADTFPEGLPTHSPSAAERPSLQVIDADNAVRRIVPSSLRAGTTLGSPTLYTQTCHIAAPMTEGDLAAFWRMVREDGYWRVKGNVSMTDGTVRKLQYTFGDQFEEASDSEEDLLLDQVVLIGPKEAFSQVYARLNQIWP